MELESGTKRSGSTGFEDEPLNDEEHRGLTSGQKRPSSPSWFLPVAFLVVGLVCGVASVLAIAAINPDAVTFFSRPGSRPRAPLSFLVVGDWGRNGDYNQSIVAESMGHVAESVGSSFVLSTGDNFYDNGLADVADPQFASSFSEIYKAKSLHTRWYSVLGNHDYRRNAQAQVDPQLKMRDARWHCERTFKVKHDACPTYLFEPCDSAVEFFFIDTTPIVLGSWKENEHNFTGLPEYSLTVHFQMLNLKSWLEASDAKWKVVVGHHPIRSTGEHGDTQELVEYVLPVLEEFGAHVYINGHDHNLELIQRDDSPITFVTSGAGSKAYRQQQVVNANHGSSFYHDGQGFVSISVDPTTFAIHFYNVLGEKLYSHVLTK